MKKPSGVISWWPGWPGYQTTPPNPLVWKYGTQITHHTVIFRLSLFHSNEDLHDYITYHCKLHVPSPYRLPAINYLYQGKNLPIPRKCAIALCNCNWFLKCDNGLAEHPGGGATLSDRNMLLSRSRSELTTCYANRTSEIHRLPAATYTVGI